MTRSSIVAVAVAVAALAVAAAGGACGKGSPGHARIVAASVATVGTGALLNITVAFVKPPPGDASELSIEMGSMALASKGAHPWAELAALDDDPATTAAAPPQPGQQLTFAIPFELKPEFKTRAGRDIDLNVSVWWGGPVDRPLMQERRVLSLDDVYKKDYGIKQPIDPRAVHESTARAVAPPR